MRKVVDVYTQIKQTPFAILEFIFGVVLVIDGVYLFLPGYDPAPSSVFLAFAATPIVSTLLGAFYVLTGIVGITGYLRDSVNIRTAASVMFFASFLFTVLIRILTVGFFPTVWVWPLLLAVWASFDYLNIQWNRSPK